MELSTHILEWINLINIYGWAGLIFLVEFIWPTKRLPFLKKGVISDCIHTFETYHHLPTDWVISWAVVLLTSHTQNGFPLQGALIGQALWLDFLVLILVSEMTFYFVHRLMHMNSFLWEFHRVHHSSTTYYSLMTSRFHIVDLLLFQIPFALIVSYLGVNAISILFFIIFQSFMDRYAHSNINGPRFTGYFINSPHFHAWHHSSNMECQNKNFSRDFVFMDYIFGTAYYPKGESPTNFGEPGYSNNFFVQQVLPFIEITKKLTGKIQNKRRVKNDNI